MRFDVMFHEESRFQTKRENKRRRDTNKCHGQVGKGQRRGERGLMATYMCKYKRGNVQQQRGLTMESGKRRTILHILALLHDKDMQWPQGWKDGDRIDRLSVHYNSEDR